MSEMDEKRRDRRGGGLVGPMILIGLGVVFLLNNLGLLAWSVWDVIFRLWPILLIAVGLDVLIGRRSIWGSLLALVLTLAILAGVVWLFESGVITGQAGAAEEITQALDGATRAEVILAPAVGRLHVEALPESNFLVSGVVRPISGERVKPDFSVQDETATLSLRSEGAFTPFTLGWGGELGWDLGLNSDVPLELATSLGAGQADLDLSGLMVSDLRVSMGVGQTTVVLPDGGRFRAKIDGAIGQTIVVIPAGLEARIRFDTALVGRNVPAGFRRQGDVYTSSGYASAEDRVDLEVAQAIGFVTIRRAGGR
jgi:hypothetical protein